MELIKIQFYFDLYKHNFSTPGFIYFYDSLDTSTSSHADFYSVLAIYLPFHLYIIFLHDSSVNNINKLYYAYIYYCWTLWNSL